MALATYWEYFTVDFESDSNPTNRGNLQRRQYISFINPQRLGLEPDNQIQTMDTVLDIMGMSGWELVSVFPIVYEDRTGVKPTNKVKAIFKRPRSDQ